jgi:hypothetical protein
MMKTVIDNFRYEPLDKRYILGRKSSEPLPHASGYVTAHLSI